MGRIRTGCELDLTTLSPQGFHRAETLGATLSIFLLWGLTLWLVGEATQRLIYRDKNIDGKVMFWLALLGLVVNCGMIIIITSSGHGHSHGHGGHSHGHGHGDGMSFKPPPPPLPPLCTAPPQSRRLYCSRSAFWVGE